MTQTKLGRALSAKPNPGEPAKVSRLKAAIEASRVWHPFVMPMLGIPAVMTLISTSRYKAIESEVSEEMANLHLELNRTNETTFELERARRTLAEAVREPDPADPTKGAGPLGTLAEWGELPPDVVGDVWRTYLDVRAAHDPVSAPLNDDELATIVDAVKKKDVVLLRFCGVRRLATFLVTTGALPAISPTPSSGPSD